MGSKLEEPSFPMKAPYQCTTAEMALWYNTRPLHFLLQWTTCGLELDFLESGILAGSGYLFSLLDYQVPNM